MAKLDLSLVVKTVDQATAPLKKVQEQINKTAANPRLARFAQGMARIGRGLQHVGRRALDFGKRAALGVAALGAALGIVTQKYANMAVETRRVSNITGISVNNLQRLRHAFKMGGLEIENADDALKDLTERIGDAHTGPNEYRETFEAMGVAIHDAQGVLRPTTDILYDIADAFQNQESEAKKAYAANVLFSEAGFKLSPVLSQGAAGLRELGDEMEALGTITEEDADQAENFIQAQEELRTSIGGLVGEVAQNIIPVLTPMIEKLTEFLGENRAAIVDGITTAFTFMAEALEAIVGWLADAVVAAMDLWTWLNDVGVIDAAVVAFGHFADAVEWVWELLKDAWEMGQNFSEWLGRVTQPLRDFVDMLAALPGMGGDANEQSLGGEAGEGLDSIIGEAGYPNAGNFGGGNANVVVDFRNLPGGTRIEQRADDNVDLEVIQGRAMAGAF